MTDQSIIRQITQALAEYLKRDAASIKPNHHLRDDLGLDSMAVIELLYKIEEKFNIQIPDQDLPALTTVTTVAGYVQKRVSPTPRSNKASAPKKTQGKGKKT